MRRVAHVAVFIHKAGNYTLFFGIDEAEQGPPNGAKCRNGSSVFLLSCLFLMGLFGDGMSECVCVRLCVLAPHWAGGGCISSDFIRTPHLVSCSSDGWNSSTEQ